MSVYGARLKQIRDMDKLRRDTYSRSKGSDHVSNLTQAEKDEKLREMQAASHALQEQRKERSGYNAASERAGSEYGITPSNGAQKTQSGVGAVFLKQMRQEIYMDSEMNLEERMNRQRHYRDRKELRKDVQD